jgi:hypothetical protein
MNHREEATTTKVVVKGDSVTSYNIRALKEAFSRYGALVSIKSIESFNLVTDVQEVPEIEITFASPDDAAKARLALEAGYVVVLGFILCSEDTFDEPCGCPYGERHGDRTYRSCFGDRCRNANHKYDCAHHSCTACYPVISRYSDKGETGDESIEYM